MAYRFFVYLLASQRNGTLYIGVTNDLARRVWEHREKLSPGFTANYGISRLVWFEEFAYIDKAIQREKSLKRWPRAWKIDLIERDNPDWNDLYEMLAL